MSGADGRSSPAGPSGAAGGDQGNGQPKHNFKVISGLTKSQIDQLRQQILSVSCSKIEILRSAVELPHFVSKRKITGNKALLRMVLSIL